VEDFAVTQILVMRSFAWRLPNLRCDGHDDRAGATMKTVPTKIPGIAYRNVNTPRWEVAVNQALDPVAYEIAVNC
jgi:hypothetical protein